VPYLTTTETVLVVRRRRFALDFGRPGLSGLAALISG
jgi:hypothetical protein